MTEHNLKNIVTLTVKNSTTIQYPIILKKNNNNNISTFFNLNSTNIGHLEFLDNRIECRQSFRNKKSFIYVNSRCNRCTVNSFDSPHIDANNIRISSYNQQSTIITNSQSNTSTNT